MSELSDLVDPSAVRLDVEAADWREAIRASGDLLVGTGAIGNSYTEAMIRTVEEHGPYIVITPGFALAHSRPDESVARTAMSFVRLAEPVAFGHESNDPVHLVMALGAADDAAHQSALAALAGVLADPDGRRALETASSVQEVLSALGAEGDPGTGTGSAAERPAGGSTAPEPAASIGTPAPAAGTDAPAPTGSTDAAAATAGATAGVGAGEGAGMEAGEGAGVEAAADTVPSRQLILTVCGNGLGTSLFLKNTAEQVLDRWGWSAHLSVEATDTISAKGRAKDADFILTSGAIAQTLGDVGVPVEVIENFTSQAEIDSALRRLYAV